MRKRIFCHGHFKTICPDVVEIEADTVVEAINGLVRQFKALGRPNLTEGTKPVAKILGFNTLESMTEKTDVQDIHLVPALGGGKSPYLQIAIGVLLVAAAFVPGLNVVVFAGTAAAFSTGSVLFALGVGMVLGGLIQVLFPVKVSDQQLDDNTYLGNPNNTVASGTPIALLFGRHMAYGQYLSYNVDAKEIL